MLSTLMGRLLFVAFPLVLGVALEQFAPAERQRPFVSVRFNLLYTVLYWAIQVGVWTSVVAAIANAAEALPGHGILSLTVSSDARWWRVLLVAILWLVLRDFWYYWFHRLQHAWPLLWVQHELHHSDPCMNATTTWRAHWLEVPLQALFVIAPFTYLVEASRGVLAGGAVIGESLAYFSHLNVRWSFGRANWLLPNPQNHRLHHSVADRHRDKNFSVAFPLWDVIFGTYCAPEAGDVPRTGLRSGVIPTWRQAVIGPLETWATWRRP